MRAIQYQRRRFLAGMSALAAGSALAPLGCLTANAGQALDRGPAIAGNASISVDAERPLRPVNPLILGNNIQWTHNADGLYGKDGRENAAFMELAGQLAPTVIRYPGGGNADFYHWQNGIGPYRRRSPSRTADDSTEVIGLGTDEYLSLCQRWGAAPLLTINIATGSADEAAQWVRYTNRRGTDLPRVDYWELGNEPYLKSSLPEANMPPEEYARRANAFIRAMKAVDPMIQVGLPLRNDALGGVEATPYPGYADTVLKGMHEPFEFAAIHGSYFPVMLDKAAGEQELFLATMAGTRTLREDMETTRAALHRHFPQRQVRLAVTEYNALYSLDIMRMGLASLLLSRTDRYIASMAGALYVADALRVFSQADDLLMANFWSLSGNWYFGAIGHDGKPRPQFEVLKAYRDLIRGDLLSTEVDSPTMPTPRVGFVPPYPDIPLLAAHATRERDTIRIAAINRHPTQTVKVRLDIPTVRQGSMEASSLTSRHYFDDSVAWNRHRLALADGAAEVPLPAHSFTLMTVAPS